GAPAAAWPVLRTQWLLHRQLSTPLLPHGHRSDHGARLPQPEVRDMGTRMDARLQRRAKERLRCRRELDHAVGYWPAAPPPPSPPPPPATTAAPPPPPPSPPPPPKPTPPAASCCRARRSCRLSASKSSGASRPACVTVKRNGILAPAGRGLTQPAALSVFSSFFSWWLVPRAASGWRSASRALSSWRLGGSSAARSADSTTRVRSCCCRCSCAARTAALSGFPASHSSRFSLCRSFAFVGAASSLNHRLTSRELLEAAGAPAGGGAPNASRVARAPLALHPAAAAPSQTALLHARQGNECVSAASSEEAA
ncbi:MAG: hypothetical protein J3K34DRAFT_152050, partial [Monoraphidium minutum]